MGTTTLHGSLASAFTDGLHSVFYSLVIILAVAAVLSAVRGRIGASEPETKSKTTVGAR